MKKFINKKGEGKEVSRSLIVNSIKNSTTKKNKILSLPAGECEIERKLYKTVSRKINYVMCELNKDVYYNLVKNGCKYFPNNPPSFHCGPISDKIFESRESDYSHLILDYCGQIGTFQEELEYVFKNNIVEVGGTISMTFNKRITKGQPSKFATMIDNLNSYMIPNGVDNRKTERVVITFINRIGGYNYDIEKVFHYHDTASMILVIVRRLS